MCKLCDGELVELIKNKDIDDSSIGWAKNQLATDLEYEDNSVMFEVRCGSGWIRIGDRSDMGCLDHGEKFEVKYCMECGRMITED